MRVSQYDTDPLVTVELGLLNGELLIKQIELYDYEQMTKLFKTNTQNKVFVLREPLFQPSSDRRVAKLYKDECYIDLNKVVYIHSR